LDDTAPIVIHESLHGYTQKLSLILNLQNTKHLKQILY